MKLLTTLAFLTCMTFCLGALVPQVDEVESLIMKNQRLLQSMDANSSPRHDLDAVRAVTKTPAFLSKLIKSYVRKADDLARLTCTWNNLDLIVFPAPG